MTRKQLVTRTEIAKMVGQDNRHFLDRDARHLKKTAWRHRWIDQIGLSSDRGTNRVGVLCPSPASLRRTICLYS